MTRVHHTAPTSSGHSRRDYSRGEGPKLEPNDFFLPFYQNLYRILLCRKQEGKPTDDVPLLAEELSPTELDQVGGIPYLAGLLDGLPKVSNLAHYADVIKTKAAVRHRMALPVVQSIDYTREPGTK